MTKDEWAVHTALIDGLWSQPGMTVERENAYYVVLQGFSSDTIGAAVQAVIREGGAFTPSAAQLLVAAEAIEKGSSGATDFTTAWDLTLRAIRKFGRDNAKDGLVWLRKQDELTAAFVEVCGWRTLALAPVEDPVRGGMERAQWERRFREFAERVETSGRLAAGSAHGELRRLPLRALPEPAA